VKPKGEGTYTQTDEAANQFSSIFLLPVVPSPDGGETLSDLGRASQKVRNAVVWRCLCFVSPARPALARVTGEQLYLRQLGVHLLNQPIGFIGFAAVLATGCCDD
jgi:hypothetical protein